MSVLKELNLKINSGEIVALVGSSGTGKSTIIQLIQRFYDPNVGEVLLDGTNIKELNPGWLREQIGVVGQEPVLFDASIEENIRLGMALEQIDSVTHQDIVWAAQEANAQEFIQTLQDGYSTYVGDRGAQLSGGQKQRIAIARALISKPKILLLDEATSALDLKSESIVQAALDRASKGRTTIIVAHRLSTIINADRIIFLDSGKVLEMGNHADLMARKSAYYNLVLAQQVTDNSEQNKMNKKKELQYVAPRQHGSTVGSNGSSLDQGSVTFLENDDELIDEITLKKAKFPYKRILKLIWNDKIFFVIALASAFIYGLGTPAYGLLLGSFIDEFTIGLEGNEEQLMSATIMYSIFFVILAISMFLSNTIQVNGDMVKICWLTIICFDRSHCLEL